MKLLISVSAPLIEEPKNAEHAQFELTNPKINREWAVYYSTHGKHLLIDGYHSYVAQHLGNATIVVLDNGYVKYLCAWNRNTANKMSYVVQQIVWQSPDAEWRGFARRMIDWFLENDDYLLLSDTQYPHGVDMYKKYILANIHKKYIYLKNNSQHTRISSTEQFNGLVDKIWSKNKSHKNVSVIISNKQLDFNYQ